MYVHVHVRAHVYFINIHHNKRTYLISYRFEPLWILGHGFGGPVEAYGEVCSVVCCRDCVYVICIHNHELF